MKETFNLVEISKRKLNILSACLEKRMANLRAEYLNQFNSKIGSVTKVTRDNEVEFSCK